MSNGNILTPEFRVSFPNVFRPQKPMQQGGEPKYGIVCLFPKDADLKELKKAAQAVVKEKWGDKPPKNLRSPFRDQGEREYEGYEEGCIFFTATSKQKPGLVDADVQDIIDETEFYAGCYARASVRFFTYDVNGNRGVGVGLQNVQKLRDGEPLGGVRAKPEDDFAPAGAGSDEGDDSENLFG